MRYELTDCREARNISGYPTQSAPMWGRYYFLKWCTAGGPPLS